MAQLQPPGMTKSGWVISGLVVLFLLMDGIMKLLALPIVLETTGQLGWPATPDMARMLALLLLVPTLLYVWPRTAFLGAILLTGYLGGAVATHVRLGNPLFSHVLFGVYLGVAMWVGLWLRDPLLRAFIPIRSDRI